MHLTPRTCDPKDGESYFDVHESMLDLFEHVLHDDYLLPLYVLPQNHVGTI